MPRLFPAATTAVISLTILETFSVKTEWLLRRSLSKRFDRGEIEMKNDARARAYTAPYRP